MYNGAAPSVRCSQILRRRSTSGKGDDFFLPNVPNVLCCVRSFDIGAKKLCTLDV